MKTLILTEKPSVAKDFAKALNIKCKGVGFYEDDQYILTWAIGHLLELKSPHEYCLKWKKWSLENLPILPDRLSYKVNYKTKKQFFIVNQQLRRKDISQIIVATDAGREGELIARTLLENAKITIRYSKRSFPILFPIIKLAIIDVTVRPINVVNHILSFLCINICFSNSLFLVIFFFIFTLDNVPLFKKLPSNHN